MKRATVAVGEHEGGLFDAEQLPVPLLDALVVLKDPNRVGIETEPPPAAIALRWRDHHPVTDRRDRPSDGQGPVL